MWRLKNSMKTYTTDKAIKKYTIFKHFNTWSESNTNINFCI